MNQAREREHSNTMKVLDEVASVDAASLGRRADLSKDINFDEVIPDFDELLNLVKQLRNRSLARLSTNHLTEVHHAASEILTLVREVRDFALAGNDPVARCDALKEKVRNAYDRAYNRLALPMSFTATQATDYSKIEREAKGLLLTVQTESKAFQDTLAKMKADAQSALANIQKQAAEAGVSQNAIYFRKDALRHRAIAAKWHKSTVVMTVATGFYTLAMLLLAFVHTPESALEAAQLLIAKVLGFSVLTITTVWCARNYAAHRHNEMVDQHRQNSLATFKTFASGAESAPVRDAILLHASSSVFGPRSTGFEPTKGEPSQPSTPVIEVLDRVAASPPPAGPQ